MRLADLDWGPPETGGLFNATYSVSEVRFRHADRSFVGVEWFRRTGHPFHPYASLVLIAEECDKTQDGALLRTIAFSNVGGQPDIGPLIVFSEVLGRKVIVLEDPRKRDILLDEALDAIL